MNNGNQYGQGGNGGNGGNGADGTYDNAGAGGGAPSSLDAFRQAVDDLTHMFDVATTGPAAAASATAQRSAARAAISVSSNASPPQDIEASRWIFENPAKT